MQFLAEGGELFGEVATIDGKVLGGDAVVDARGGDGFEDRKGNVFGDEWNIKIV